MIDITAYKPYIVFFANVIGAIVQTGGYEKDRFHVILLADQC